MRIREFLFLASFLIALTRRFSALGQKVSESLIRDCEAEKNDSKVTFDDRVVVIEPHSTGRENNPGTREPISRYWSNNDDTAYWESIYDSTNDIRAFDDLSKIKGDTIELGSARESTRFEDTRDKREIIRKNITKSNEILFSDFDNESLTRKSYRRVRSSDSTSRDRSEPMNSLLVGKDSSSRRGRVEHQPCLDCKKMDLMANHRTSRAAQDENSVLLDFVQTHLSHGYNLAEDMHDRARSLAAVGFCPNPHTASMLNFIHSKSHNDLVSLNEQSELTLFGTKFLQQKLSENYNIAPHDFLEFLNRHKFRIRDTRVCGKIYHKRCDPYADYRSLDGSCNNLAYSSWGRANTAFGRILPARYSDGIYEMPISVTNTKLPNARKLSTRLMTRGVNYDPELSLAVMQWGQILAHDLARQVPDQTIKGGIECCAHNGKSRLGKRLQHHSCAPIKISPMDNFYSRHGQRCMNFVRSMTVLKDDCILGPADQLNAVTSFLDCSQMYGVSESESNQLRQFMGGRLRVEFRHGRWMLPLTINQSIYCDVWTADDLCYRSGDPRTSQNPQLVVLHTLLVREHNRIADVLSMLNPHWSDEKIFQETRRIVIAEYQHITYNEWLPLLLGDRYARVKKLSRTNRGMSNNYNGNVDPSTIVGFTTGAFRSLHSMVAGDIGVFNRDRDLVDVLRLDNHYFRPRVIEKNNNFEGLLRGLVTQYSEMQDTIMNSQLTEYLFRSRNAFGMDLNSIDIQRGRDHGVPGYNAYRKICKLEMAEDFDDLNREISWENIEKLRREYAHVDDIDLLVGAYMENRLPGSRFGPTNRCIIGEQFYRSRVGDRYFYDNADFPHSFTPEQFDEITKVTFARLMCDTENDVGTIQPDAFRAISPGNPLIPCGKLPKMDLTLWIE